MQCDGRILTEDCLFYCFEYLDADEVAFGVCYVCKHWGQLGSDDSLWRKLCAVLWKDKQNHPLERWMMVSLPTTLDLFNTALGKYENYSNRYSTMMLDNVVTGSMLQTMYRSLLDPILEISNDRFSEGVSAADMQEYQELLSEMEALRDTTRAYWAEKMKHMVALTREKYGNMEIARRFYPRSCYARAIQIQVELDRCLSMFEDISIEEFLILNRNIESRIMMNLEGRLSTTLY